MAKTGGDRAGWFGRALGVLAALTLVLATPQHLLDFDEGVGPVAEQAVHGHAHAVMDHAQKGHSCAAHCAAHVIGGAPPAAALQPPPLRVPVWAIAGDQDSRAGPSFLLERPPKA